MNANDPAFPFPSGPEPRVNQFHDRAEGLTIRAHMATQAMQGLLASMPDAENAEREERPIESLGSASKRLAIASVAYADALIAELNKPVALPVPTPDRVVCSCGEPHISDRIQHCYDGTPCFVKP